jgi:mono/diheme cytochrome c family protein
MAARRRVGLVVAAIAAALLAVVASIVTVFLGAPSPRADPANAGQVALGKKVYAQHCASCHDSPDVSPASMPCIGSVMSMKATSSGHGCGRHV